MNIASVVRQQNRRRAKGLTLIELVLVVAILAILAGFIVPRLGFIRNLAGDAGNATIIADSASQVVLFNTAIGHYPAGEDTLLDTAGLPYASLQSKLKGAITPLAFSGDALGALSFTSQLTGSSSGGNVTLYNHDLTATIPSNSGTSATVIGSTGGSNSDPSNIAPGTGSGTIAQITVPTAPDVTAKKTNYLIYLAAYGATKLNSTTGAPTDGTYLVALGYGPNTEINGKSALEAPLLFDKNPGEYNRPSCC